MVSKIEKKIQDLMRGNAGAGIVGESAAAATQKIIEITDAPPPAHVFAYARGYADGMLRQFGISPEPFGPRDGLDEHAAGLAAGCEENHEAILPAEPGIIDADDPGLK